MIHPSKTGPGSSPAEDPWSPESFARRLRRGHYLFWGHLLLAWLIGCVGTGYLLLEGADVADAVVCPVGAVAYSLVRKAIDRAL